MTQSNASVVGAEYRDETRLAPRRAAHASGEGRDAREVVFAAIGEARPREKT